VTDHVARYNSTLAFHLLSQCNIFVGNQGKVKLHVLLIVNVSYREWTGAVNFQWDDDEIRFVLDQQAELVSIVLAHWNNSPRVDISLHSDKLFWFRANIALST
jgi:hypothetical protein